MTTGMKKDQTKMILARLLYNVEELYNCFHF